MIYLKWNKLLNGVQLISTSTCKQNPAVRFWLAYLAPELSRRKGKSELLRSWKKVTLGKGWEEVQD